MSNEKKVDLIAVHEVHIDKDIIAPGKPFSTDAKTADYLLSIGAAQKPKAAAPVEAAAEETGDDKADTKGKK